MARCAVAAVARYCTHETAYGMDAAVSTKAPFQGKYPGNQIEIRAVGLSVCSTGTRMVSGINGRMHV
eukprot:7124854-Prymnesium_polylepis.1